MCYVFIGHIIHLSYSIVKGCVVGVRRNDSISLLYSGKNFAVIEVLLLDVTDTWSEGILLNL